MNKHFQRFRRKARIDAFLKSLFISLSFGLLACSVFVFLYRLRILNVPDPYAFAIGGAVTVISLIITFKILVPSDEALAKRMDAQFRLKAKVQTMVANQNSFKPIHKLQREDTEEALSKIPTKYLSEKHLLAYLVPIVLTAAMLTVALLWPQTLAPKPPTPDGPGDDYEITQWQIVALNELIAEVEGSSLEEIPRIEIVKALKNLATTLQNTNSSIVMKNSVIAVIRTVREEVDTANSYAEIKEALNATENPDMIEFAKALGTMSIPMTIETVSNIKALFNEGNHATRVSIFKADLENALAASGTVQNNRLYKVITDFLLELAAVPDSVEEYELALEGVFENCVFAVSGAIKQQLTNARLGERIELKLIEIFGITAEELPEKEDNDGYEDSDKVNDEQKGDDAGIGSGDTLYGSEDEVLDIIDKIRVEYGDIFNQYYPDAMDKVYNSDLPDEVKDFIEKYFAYLLGATTPDGESNSNQ